VDTLLEGFRRPGGAYVFTALASRGLARGEGRRLRLDPDGRSKARGLDRRQHEQLLKAHFRHRRKLIRSLD
jgi:hypothetical protein